MTHETTPLSNRTRIGQASRLAMVVCCFLAAALLCLPGCSRREVFETESAAKAALVGKTSRDIIARLGAPNSVAMAGNADDRSRRFTEVWKYSRLIRDPKTRELKTMNVYFFRNRAVSVEIEK